MSMPPMPASLLALRRDWYRTAARLHALVEVLPEQEADWPPAAAEVWRAGRERQARLWAAVWAHPYWAAAPARARVAERVALRTVGRTA
ncbi:hypothetical protein ACFW9F_01350 [Streptomyces sp. NPDC059506]|uniref:hypothetical protein n=1 Tax=Streptomyces sp. NPDC059506 TaxID=3347751 RepID=UPI0036C705FA